MLDFELQTPVPAAAMLHVMQAGHHIGDLSLGDGGCALMAPTAHGLQLLLLLVAPNNPRCDVRLGPS